MKIYKNNTFKHYKTKHLKRCYKINYNLKNKHMIIQYKIQFQHLYNLLIKFQII